MKMRNNWGAGRAGRMALAAGAILLAGGTAAKAGDSSFEWGFYNLNEVKWSTRVPGYDPHIIHGRRLTETATGVHFSMKWPVNGLVAGHAQIQTPLIVKAAEAAVVTATGSAVLKVANWARNVAISANNFKQIVPMGVCEGKSGKLKDNIGQFDPENRTCYIPRYDGRGWWIEDTKDFKVLVATPALATWTSKAVADKNRKALDVGGYVNYTNYSGTICRAAFTPPKAELIKAVTGALRSDTLFKITPKTELLVGRVYNDKRPGGGVCVHAYKEPVLGKRFPVVSKDYEVLTVESDNTYSRELKGWMRSMRVALQHEASGKCLALGGGKTPELVDCFKPRVYPTTMLELTAFGLVRSWRYNRCLRSSWNDLVTGCGRSSDSYLTWFYNRQGRLRGAYGSCLTVKGGKPVVERDCRLQSVAQEEKWKLLTFYGMEVRQSGDLPLKVAMTGNPTESCTETTEYCTAWALHGTKMAVSVRNEKKGTFEKWTDGPCKNKTTSTCSFTFTAKTDSSLKFKIKSDATMQELVDAVGFMLIVKKGDKCVDDTGARAKGKQVHVWDCAKKNKNQRWVLTPKDKKAKDPKLFVIRSKRTGMCLDVRYKSKKNGEAVHMWPCTGNDNQTWELVKMDMKNWFNLRASHSGKCLDLSGGNTRNGSKFIQWTCNTGSTNQRFRVGG